MTQIVTGMQFAFPVYARFSVALRLFVTLARNGAGFAWVLSTSEQFTVVTVLT